MGMFVFIGYILVFWIIKKVYIDIIKFVMFDKMVDWNILFYFFCIVNKN